MAKHYHAAEPCNQMRRLPGSGEPTHIPNKNAVMQDGWEKIWLAERLDLFSATVSFPVQGKVDIKSLRTEVREKGKPSQDVMGQVEFLQPGASGVENLLPCRVSVRQQTNYSLAASTGPTDRRDLEVCLR